MKRILLSLAATVMVATLCGCSCCPCGTCKKAPETCRNVVADREPCDRGGQRQAADPGPGGVVAYPYYTTRGPRDFLDRNPQSIGP